LGEGEANVFALLGFGEEFEEVFVVLDRRLFLAPVVVFEGGEVEVGGGELGVELEGAVEMGGGGFEVAEPGLDDAEGVLDVGVGVGIGEFFEGGFGGLPGADAKLRAAELVVGAGKGRPELGQLPEVRDGEVGVAGFELGDGEVVARGGVGGVELEGFFEGGDGGVGLTGLEPADAEKVPRLGRRGAAGDGLFEVSGGAGEFFFLVIGDAPLEAAGRRSLAPSRCDEDGHRKKSPCKRHAKRDKAVGASYSRPRVTQTKMTEWDIQPRSPVCTGCQQPFADKQVYHTWLALREVGYQRRDLCAVCSAAAGRDGAVSYWQGEFKVPPPPPPEPIQKETAETLLRKLCASADPTQAAPRYILAVMLERKKLLKHRDTIRDEQGGERLVYEHAQTGESFTIPDPHLRLDQLAEVQSQVAELLGPTREKTEAGCGRSTDADLDLLRLGLFRLRERDVQHAVAERRRHLAGVHARGQLQRPRELARDPFPVIEVGVLLLDLVTAFTFDGEIRVMDRDGDVVLRHARQVHLDEEIVLLFDHVHGRGKCDIPTGATAAQRRVKDAVHFLADVLEVAEGVPQIRRRFPTNQCHDVHLHFCFVCLQFVLALPVPG
jgi:hypothetical protein